MSWTDQQEAAIASRGKVIVSASAGSGKTAVMIERFVSILRKGEAGVREILAVTFTKKAAAQMRERARLKLAEAYRSSSGEERARLLGQLEDLPLASISTIHAFCARLVRTYFYLLDLDPRFVIVDGNDAAGRSLSSRALDLAFERAYEGGEEWFMQLLSAYFRKKKDATLRKLIAGLYEKMRALDGYRERLLKMSGKTAFSLQEEIADARAFVLSDDPDRAELKEIVRYIAAEEAAHAGSILRRAQALHTASEALCPRALPLLEAIEEGAARISSAGDLFAMYEEGALITLPRSPARRASDPEEVLHAIGQAQALAKELKELVSRLSETPDWGKEFMRYGEGRARAAALAKLTLMYDEEYTRLKREAGVLDYGDLEHLALSALKREEVQTALRQTYRFIFVDEYQDVNPLQGEILNCLTGEELFVVGDKKQAIYGFRGSRTEYFTQMERSCGGALPLDRNFRSAKAILDAVNTVFCAVYRGSAGYIPMTGGDRFQGHTGEVLCHSVEREKKQKRERGVYSVAEAGERKVWDPLAERIAGIVARECAQGEIFDADKGCERKVGYGDIAILVRKNSGSAPAIVTALGEHGIPVTSSAGVNICDFFEIRLLIDWLSLLDNGEQDIPLASAMLSALGGFDEHELALIRLRTGERFRGAPFRTAVRYLARQPGVFSQKIGAFLARVETYRTLCRVKTASEMLSILLADGLEAQIAGMGGGNSAIARVRRLLEESADAGDIHDFLRRIKDADEKILYAESGGEGAVRVLTMHASKGLEFPVVIVADLDTPFHGADRDETMWTEKFGLAPRSFDFQSKVRYETLKRRAAAICMQKEEIEGEKNLLYVAMTRAIYRLHLVFESEFSGEEENLNFDPDRAVRLSDLIPREKLLGLLVRDTEQTEEPPREEQIAADPAAAEEIISAIKPYPHAAATLLPVKSSATSLIRDAQALEEKRAYHVCDEDERETLISDADAVFSTETGLAYHAFLEHADFAGDAEEELLRMRREGLLSKEQIDLLDVGHLTKILKTPLLCALAKRRTWRERQFLASLPASEFYEGEEGDAVIFQGAIDLLAEEDGGYLIVDYKFSSRSPAGIRAHYAPQIALYRRAVAKIGHIPLERVRAVILNIATLDEINM